MSSVVKKGAEVREFPNRRAEKPTSQSAIIQPFFNRELSLLGFHGRVLEEALDESNPLLERLKFLSIFASNIDEFFMIRVSGLKEELENVTDPSADGMTPAEQLDRIREILQPMIAAEMNCLRFE